MATSSNEFRAPGIVAIALIVAAGLGAGAGVYRFEQPRVQAEVARRLADAPRTPEGRLRAWLEFGAPSIHQRLVTARVSWSQPWLVTHTVRSEVESEPPSVYGLDLTGIGVDVSELEGMRVVVRLPLPGRLGKTFLAGRNAFGVPSYTAESEAPDTAVALAAKVEWLLADLETALRKDIEGASIEVVVDPSLRDASVTR